METQRIQPGLWTWSAPHPDWKPENDKPGGWGQIVTSVFFDPTQAPKEEARSERSTVEAARPAIVLIDPLAPPDGTADGTKFWKALDADIERAGLPVAILLGNEYHSRSVRAIVERYAKHPGASVWGHAFLRGKAAVEPTRTFRGEDVLPAGVRSYPLPALTGGEVAYFIPDARTLVFADAMIGAGSGTLRVCPPSWAEDAERYEKDFRGSIRRLLDLDARHVIVSHGPSILEEGRRALADALDAPAWGM